MDSELEKRIAAIAADRESGAAEILGVAIGILRDARRAEGDLREVADALRRAQPSMAPMWNATAAALRGDLDRFAQRAARAPKAIARFAFDLLETGVPAGGSIRIVTLSYSSTVAAVLESCAQRRALEVACGEGRPGLEGRRLALRLSKAGIVITYYLDAAIGAALDTADAVLVGADAVSAEWFLNKSGTRMLAAAAVQRGVPVYVVAGREKFLTSDAAEHLVPTSGPATEVWPDAAKGIAVLNPYFERTPVELVAAFVSDIGPLGPSDLAEVSRDI